MPPTDDVPPDDLLAKVDRASIGGKSGGGAALLIIASWSIVAIAARARGGRGNVGKWLLRQVTDTAGLPRDIVERPKMGFYGANRSMAAGPRDSGAGASVARTVSAADCWSMRIVDAERSPAGGGGGGGRPAPAVGDSHVSAWRTRWDLKSGPDSSSVPGTLLTHRTAGGLDPEVHVPPPLRRTFDITAALLRAPRHTGAICHEPPEPLQRLEPSRCLHTPATPVACGTLWESPQKEPVAGALNPPRLPVRSAALRRRLTEFLARGHSIWCTSTAWNWLDISGCRGIPSRLRASQRGVGPYFFFFPFCFFFFFFFFVFFFFFFIRRRA